jgi:hypothetical protein
MKHIYLAIIMFSFILTMGVTAVDVVDNPGHPVPDPKMKKIGRTIKMTEVFRISDKDGDFFLKNPGNIRVAPDGSVFLMDRSQLHLFKFNSDGKFLTSMLKKGEGPGDLINLRSYWLDNKEIIATSYMPVKIICMDHQGKLIKEFRVITNEYIFNFVGHFGLKYYFYIDPLVREDGLITLQNRLVAANEKGVITETELTLPVKRVKYTYQVRDFENSLSVYIKSANITRFNYAIAADRYLYVTASERYLIHLYDFEKDRVIKKFRRQYTPVPYTPNPDDEFVNSSKFKSLYKWELYTDVYHLLADGDRVWALTSTIDKTKGILVDVFNPDGVYIDRFYMQIPNLKFPDDKMVEHLYYHDGFLYTIELDDADTPYIVKYKPEEESAER